MSDGRIDPSLISSLCQLVLLLGSALPASAQMMGGGGMMEMAAGGMPGAGPMGGCPGMATPAVAFGYEGPWISFALAHAKEIDLAPDQVKALTALREEFQKEAIRLTAEIRAAEIDLRQLYRQKPVDLRAVEANIRAIVAREADLRLARVKTLESVEALLTIEPQQKLGGIARTMGRMRGAFMTGEPPDLHSSVHADGH